MNIRQLILTSLLTGAGYLHAAGLVEVIETQPLPNKIIKGEQASATWLIRSSAKVDLPDFKMLPEGINITETTCSGTLNAKSICQVSGQFIAETVGEYPVKLVVTAAKEAYRFSSAPKMVTVFEEIPDTPGSNEAILYYKRPQGDYSGWGLHLFNEGNCNASGIETDWNAPLMPEEITQTYGAKYRIPLTKVKTTRDDCLNFIVHKGDEQNLGGNMTWPFTETDGQLAYTYSGYSLISATPLVDPPLVIDGAKAHWVSANTLLWNEGTGGDVDKLVLIYSDDARLRLANGKITGDYQTISLAKGGSISNSVKEKLPHLKDRSPLTVSADASAIKRALKGRLLAVAYANNQPKYVTRVQIQGVLDELYSYKGELGSIVGTDNIAFNLWAPTAQKVRLTVRPTGEEAPQFYNMAEAASGVWSYTHPDKSLERKYYRYEVTVYHPQSGNIEIYEVTDPYSLSLSTNSQYSQVVNLEDDDLKPDGWSELKYTTPRPEDMVLYETHVRDYSGNNPKFENPGKFLAFTEDSANAHLKQLQSSGLTHVHLLPAFDIATVDEDPANRVDISQSMGVLCQRTEVKQDADYFKKFCKLPTMSITIKDYLTSLEPSSSDAQYLYKHIRPIDSFNWGYDPYHYTTPEGSYSTDPEGVKRIMEFRKMVKSLKGAELGVVMDVVYNHTHAHGPADQSVLDKIVPWYYQRLNPDSGIVENSTCCSNTASEFDMMEKLMIDSLKVWVKHYKVDAFRFDLMGHHLKRNMVKALAAVHSIKGAEQVYFYGEGWEFGEVADNARGVNANQINMAGTGVGTFTDRMRDRIRGGSPFDEANGIRSSQGYATGLYHFPNEAAAGIPVDYLKASLCEHSDMIRLGMAANLKYYRFVDCHDTLRYGMDYDYNGAPAGYSTDPQEVINYVSKHDNQTLWDILMYKLPRGTTTENRVKFHNLALGIALLSQGVPFIHAGSERLRSKSMERDSYDSGDWYNRMPDKDDNYWNQGLPREDKDGSNWELIKKIIADETTRPSQTNIAGANVFFKAMLNIRKSSKLFRLETGQDVIDRITYLNTGSAQIPGLIIQRISDEAPHDDIDDSHEVIIVAVNPSGESVYFPVAEIGTYVLHPMFTGDSGATGDADDQGIVGSIGEQGKTGEVGRESSTLVLAPIKTTAKMTNSQITIPALSIVVFVKHQESVQPIE